MCSGARVPGLVKITLTVRRAAAPFYFAKSSSAVGVRLARCWSYPLRRRCKRDDVLIPLRYLKFGYVLNFVQQVYNSFFKKNQTY